MLPQQLYDNFFLHQPRQLYLSSSNFVKEGMRFLPVIVPLVTYSLPQGESCSKIQTKRCNIGCLSPKHGELQILYGRLCVSHNYLSFFVAAAV